MRFPASNSVDDLVSPFRENVRKVLTQLELGGAVVHISATLRPPERAYLMHWACAIVHGLPANMCPPGIDPEDQVDPSLVPPMDGVDINWTHNGDTQAAMASAKAMLSAYNVVFPPALNSRHCEGRAIDMSIRWSGELVIHDAAEKRWVIRGELKTEMNPALWEIVRSYGVIKLKTDPPHWSDDGR
jgi:hypothetical protein